jgi:hypothetical protein
LSWQKIKSNIEIFATVVFAFSQTLQNLRGTNMAKGQQRKNKEVKKPKKKPVPVAVTFSMAL